jgi:polar amino acid transport system substrate-binding protein
MYKTLHALLLGLLLILTSSHALSQTKITLAASTSPPYADKQLPEQGLAIEVVTHVYKRAGYTPEIQFETWSRAMEGVSVGLVDALAAAWYSEARAEEYLFSDPYLATPLILLKLRSDPAPYRDVSQLAGKRLGTQVDFAYGVDFKDIPGLKLVPENHAIQNLLGLLNGKVDIVIGDQRTLAMQLHTYLAGDLHKFQVVHANLPTRPRHVAASRAIAGGDKMVVAFNRALAAARKDGSYAAIVAKWDERYPLN